METMRMNAFSILSVGKRDPFEEERQTLRRAFLKKEGLLDVPCIPLPPDASRRRYFRLPQSLLMDAPPPYEETKPFHTLAEILKDVGLTVPLIYAADHIHGFLLIEDLGELPYRKALQKGICEKLLYGETLKSLIHLHQNMSENKAHLSLYNREAFLKEVAVAKHLLEEVLRDAYEEVKAESRHYPVRLWKDRDFTGDEYQTRMRRRRRKD